MFNLYTLEQIKQLNAMLLQSTGIVIVSHTNPDGDALGSSLSLCNALQNKGIESKVVIPNFFPDYYKFLPNSEKIIIASENVLESAEAIAASDLIISVDFNSFSRISQLEKIVRESKAKKVLIDHHVSPEEGVFDLMFSKVEISSASEYVYWILEALYGRNFLTKEIAECIYAGICTDTGSFSYSCNYTSTYQALMHLMETGIDCEDLHYKIYNTFSEKRLRLLGYCLSEKMTVLPEISAAYITLSKEELARFDYRVGDTEGVVNYTLMMSGVNVGILLVEYPERVRISFRSKNDFDVNLFAGKYFNGGGHRKASGGYTYKSLKEATVLLEKALKESLTGK